MPDHPTVPSPDLLSPMCNAAAQAIRAKLDETPLHPRVFDEISTYSKHVYKAATAIQPTLDIPKPHSGPVAPAPASEGVTHNLARQLIDAFSSRRDSKSSSLDLIKAIALAEREGLTVEAERLRAQLFDGPEDPDMLTPRQKVDRANRLMEAAKSQHEEAKMLLASIRDDEIDDAPVPVDVE